MSKKVWTTSIFSYIFKKWSKMAKNWWGGGLKGNTDNVVTKHIFSVDDFPQTTLTNANCLLFILSFPLFTTSKWAAENRQFCFKTQNESLENKNYISLKSSLLISHFGAVLPQTILMSALKQVTSDMTLKNRWNAFSDLSPKFEGYFRLRNQLRSLLPSLGGFNTYLNSFLLLKLLSELGFENRNEQFPTFLGQCSL